MSGIEAKVVVITGASSGIGKATALLLAERGARVVLGARGLDHLKTLAERITAAGGEAAYAATDVKRREDLSKSLGWQLSGTASSTFSLTMRESHQFLFSTSSVSRIGRR